MSGRISIVRFSGWQFNTKSYSRLDTDSPVGSLTQSYSRLDTDSPVGSLTQSYSGWIQILQ